MNQALHLFNTLMPWHALATFSHLSFGKKLIFLGLVIARLPMSKPNTIATACFGRRLVLPKMSMKELNQKLSVIMRVVVHPKYRTIGLGQRLVRETLPRAGTPFVELIAVMAKYNPFAERAGMTKIAEQPPAKKALKIAEILCKLRFNITFFGSKKYVLNKLGSLKPENLKKVREAFKENVHPRFMKEFFYHKPYGKAKLFKEKVTKANLEKLAKLIKIVGLLLQTKVYLIWKEKNLELLNDDRRARRPRI